MSAFAHCHIQENILSTHTICMNYDSYSMYGYHTTHMHECICTLPHTREHSFNMYEHYTTYMHEYVCLLYNMYESYMGWLRLVGSIELEVSFAKEPYRRDDILQKRPIILSILLTVATPWYASILHYTHARGACAYEHYYTHVNTLSTNIVLLHDACHWVKHIRTHSASRGAYRAQIKQGCTHGHATCQFPPLFLLFFSSIFLEMNRCKALIAPCQM